jgi:hypothetical protein
MSERVTIADHFFCFGEDDLVKLHCIKSPSHPILITSLKSHNLNVVPNRAESSIPFDNPIFQQTANSTRGCAEMVINMAVGIGNVCKSKRWKAEQVIFRSCIQTPISFSHLVAQKPDQTPVYPVCLEPDQY